VDGDVAAASAASLPLYLIAEVMLALIVGFVGVCSSTTFQRIRHDDFAAQLSYDHAVFSGFDFQHFNHRTATPSL